MGLDGNERGEMTPLQIETTLRRGLSFRSSVSRDPIFHVFPMSWVTSDFHAPRIARASFLGQAGGSWGRT